MQNISPCTEIDCFKSHKWLLVLALVCLCCSKVLAQETPYNRISPPSAISCSPNQLTSWSGTITHYERINRHIRFVIHTDENTLERGSLEMSNINDPSKELLMMGQTFTKNDWSKIETAPGRLRADIRATAWVCEDGSTPIVLDWQP